MNTFSIIQVRVKKFKILVKTSPMAGPNRRRIAITIKATKTRIIAYSTKPWPFSRIHLPNPDHLLNLAAMT
jgi:hypothetical protein